MCELVGLVGVDISMSLLEGNEIGYGWFGPLQMFVSPLKRGKRCFEQYDDVRENVGLAILSERFS